MGSAGLLIVAVLGGLLLIPTRRLYLAGHGPRTLAAYLGGMLLLALLVAELRAPARYLVPVLLVGYIAPFVTWRAGLARLLRGPTGATPPRRVAGTDRDPERAEDDDR